MLATDPDQRASRSSELLRAAFIPWLATINPDNDQPMRRVARWSDLPEDSRPLIDAFVAKRLMVKDERDGRGASSRSRWKACCANGMSWPAGCANSGRILRPPTTWNATPPRGRQAINDPAWLLEGTRLSDAETLAAARVPPATRRHPRLPRRLAAAREPAPGQPKKQHRQAELRNAQERQHTAEAHAATLRKRSRILRAVLAATTLVAVIAVVGATVALYETGQARKARNEALQQPPRGHGEPARLPTDQP